MKRPTYPRQAKVLVIGDMPTISECDNDAPWTAASNSNLLTSLRTGRINVFDHRPVLGWRGIPALNIASTYLDYSWWGGLDNNLDYIAEISKIHLPGFIPFKNVYISQRLYNEYCATLEYIDKINPKVVILVGKWSLFFLLNDVSLRDTQGGGKAKRYGALNKYRGTILIEGDRIFYMMYHPVVSVALPESAPVMELDIQKVADILYKLEADGIESFNVKYKYHTGPAGYIYLYWLLDKLEHGNKLTITADIETMFYSGVGTAIMDCIGLAHSPTEGGCIAFCTNDTKHILSLEEEQNIICTLYQVLTHPNATIIWHNGSSFDVPWIQHRWCFTPKIEHDTLIANHILYNFLPKDLAFLASIYCETTQYWKDEISGNVSERWFYNVKDCLYTYAIFNAQKEQLESTPSLCALYKSTMYDLLPAVLDTVQRGILVDVNMKQTLLTKFSDLAITVENTIKDIVGIDFNVNSVQQRKQILADLFGITLQTKTLISAKDGGEKRKVTVADSAAMLSYMDEYPMAKPFIALLLEHTAISKFARTFLSMELDPDGRVRTTFKLAGTATGRLSSSKNPFNRAANMQNLPTKGKLELNYSTVIAGYDTEDTDDEFLTFSNEGNLLLPNVKKMFVPYPGMEMMDCDLSGADAMAVAWDSECLWLIDFFQKGVGKLYAYIASEHLQREITSKSPEYKVYKGICHGCVTGEHEVLTLNGWKRIDEFDEHTEQLAVWDINTQAITFEKPSGFTRSYVESTEPLVEISGDSYKQVVTLDHKFPYYSGETLSITTANKLDSIPNLRLLAYKSSDIFWFGNSIRTKVKIAKINHYGTKVYCPQTSTGFFMVRYGNHIMVTGNSNYGLGIDKLAKIAKISQDSAVALQNWYFTRCPQLLTWQSRLRNTIAKQGYIENIFGRRRYFLDKHDPTLYNKAYGFIGQSTVADTMNIAWPRVAAIQDVIVSLQVHDSLVSQYPIDNAEETRHKIISAMSVVIPYKTPLVIPVDYKVSTVSYGDM